MHCRGPPSLGLIPDAAWQGHTPKAPTAPPAQPGPWGSGARAMPMKAHWLHGILSRVSAWRPGASPLTKHPPPLTSIGAELPHPIQSPELLGPGPLRRQSAASLWLSHHGFVQLLQHLRRYVCPGSLGSDHVSGGGGGGSVDSPAKGPRQPCRLTAKKARHRSAGSLVSRRQVCPERHRLVVWLLWHTHGFSFLFSVMMVLVVWSGGR